MKPDSPDDIVVTGINIVSSIGNSISEFKSNMFAGKSGIVDIRGIVAPPNSPISYAALVKGTVPRARSLEGICAAKIMPGTTSIAYMAENLIETCPPSIDGIIWADAEGDRVEIIIDTFSKKQFDAQKIATRYSEGNLQLLRKILTPKMHKGTQSFSISNTCVTGTLAIGMAMQRLRAGIWRNAIVGAEYFGSNYHNILILHMIGAVSQRTDLGEELCCPFSKNRSGLVSGDGAGFMVLEKRKDAEARGAEILAIVSGFGQTSDSYRMTDSREDVKGTTRAMRDAISSAGLTIAQIGYINAHGSSTPLNDRLETLAIKEVFGKRAYDIPISSLKSQVGHTLNACGLIEGIASVIMLMEQRLAPTINYRIPDPDCDLDYVPNHSRPHQFQYMLKNSFGFGGQNVCLVFKAA